ncbi:hypothetical protein IGI04_002159 [Brassica rapa subsp. trilocularis]|uniref:Gamma-tubulin complex component n=1 Tax=Brassica rapa subsp. trilocularis TaxID=1813537 RepID=A0ABQ7NUS2_BRACM|nr:hypothetical protein IGI04_002159 [Brassica rapa subsp. trilocularis]
MATSVDSLLEKLKQEELYLSTNRQFPPPTRASPLSSSFVSELSLVKLVLNALQGVESSLISIHKLSYVLCSEPADRANPPKSELVASAFAIAMKKVLEGYISGLDTLCASAELRRSSNIVVL